MTTIAAYSHEGKVYMAGDSAISYGDLRQLDPIGKVWVNDLGMVIGVAGLSKALHFIRYGFQWPVPTTADEADLEGYMRVTLPKALYAYLKEELPQCVEKDSDSKPQMLIGYQGKIWMLDDDLFSTRCGAPFDAIGTGSEYAKASLLTAMSVLNVQKVIGTPESLLRTALLAASTFDNKTHEPFYVLSELDKP